MLACARCGAESPDGFRFCPACGAAFPEAPAPRQARKVVTALFSDVTGSTALGEQLDPEVLRGVINKYFAEMRATIEHHGGTVDRVVGDAMMAVFGIPRVQEDDALRAVRAAAEIRDRLPAIADEVGVALRFRTGVNTGPVLMGEGENLAIGDAINVAARLEQAAQPGEILLGEQTLRLVRDAVEVEALEPLELKGKSARVPAYRLVRVDPAAPGVARHFDVRLVGRRRELALLHQAWERTIEESRCHLFTLLGEAGVGKSRLVNELLSDVGDGATVLRGRCLPYGEGITFWPLVEALMPLGEPAADVLEHVSSGGTATPEELFWEVRRLLESLAAERPVVLHLDDLHWGETMLLDLLDHVADLSRGAPILLLCAARPELLDDRPAWGGGKLTATTVLLEPLVGEESEALLDALGDGLDQDARTRVIQASDGNPLFMEEMVALARERGTVEVPPTIQALLAARLERLGVEERELLERGAVEGEVFHRLAVKALAGEQLAAEVELRLSGLVRKELIRPHPATLSGDEAFRFRHLLIRDAAYDGLPKAIRAQLHERFARWLENVATELLEIDEIAGWHLEQVVRYQQELGREVDPALARSAAEHLHAAGRRATGRSDVRAANNLLARAVALVPEDDPLRARVAVELAEQLIEAGEFARAEELIASAETDPASGPLAILARMQLMMNTRPKEALEIVPSELPALLDRLEREGHHQELAAAHLVAFQLDNMAGQARQGSERARLAAVHAAKAGNEGLRQRALGWYLTELMWGTADDQTIERELAGIERAAPGPYLGAFVDLAHGEICRLRGDFEQAMRLTQRCEDTLEALGMRTIAAPCALHFALIHLSAGNPVPAVEALERSDAILSELGERAFRSTVQAHLAAAYALLPDPDRAAAACDLSEELSAPGDVINFAIIPRVRARIALAEGDGAQAEEQARSALHAASQTDLLLTIAAAKLDLARILGALGSGEEAGAEAREALAIHQTKGDRPGVAEAQAVLDEL
jgi:class 3 adenylate cyclase